MADIKIEKKGGSLWWVWALIALAIIALIIWFFVGNDRDRVAQAPAAVTAPAARVADADMTPVDRGNGQPITDLAAITNSNDASLDGREVRLSNVPVGMMAGDASFWVNDATGEKVYVVLNEVATPGTPIEGRVDVNQGDKVDLVGTLRNASGGAPQGAAEGTKTDPLPQGITHYIYAQSAKVVS